MEEVGLSHQKEGHEQDGEAGDEHVAKRRQQPCQQPAQCIHRHHVGQLVREVGAVGHALAAQIHPCRVAVDHFKQVVPGGDELLRIHLGQRGRLLGQQGREKQDDSCQQGHHQGEGGGGPQAVAQGFGPHAAGGDPSHNRSACETQRNGAQEVGGELSEPPQEQDEQGRQHPPCCVGPGHGHNDDLGVNRPRNRPTPAKAASHWSI